MSDPLPLKSIKAAFSNPRESPEGQACLRKKKFNSQEEALAVRPDQVAYVCEFCNKWHLTKINYSRTDLLKKINELKTENKELKRKGIKKLSRREEKLSEKIRKFRIQQNEIKTWRNEEIENLKLHGRVPLYEKEIAELKEEINKLKNKLKAHRETKPKSAEDFRKMTESFTGQISGLLEKFKSRTKEFYDLYNKIKFKGMEKLHLEGIECDCLHELDRTKKKFIKEPVGDIIIGTLNTCLKCGNQVVVKNTQILGEGVDSQSPRLTLLPNTINLNEHGYLM